MFDRLANLITRHWLLIIGGWLALLVGLRLVAPPWETITHDGDFAYLPNSVPSVVGEAWLARAFPDQRAKSQIVIALIQPTHYRTKDSLVAAYDTARRMKNLLGASRVAFIQKTTRLEASLRVAGKLQEADLAGRQIESAAEEARNALDDAISFDEDLASAWDSLIAKDSTAANRQPPRLAEAYFNLGLLEQFLGQDKEAEENFRIAGVLAPPSMLLDDPTPRPLSAAKLPLLDVWTWQGEFGSKLISGAGHDHRARLVVLQLSNEFMAVDNIQVLRQIEAQLREVQKTIEASKDSATRIAITGSAAVGADLLRSAAASIKHTEWFTIVLVILILAFIYRSPLLVAVPLVSIGIALSVSTSLIALLTQLSSVPGFHWWTLKAFTTTRIFIVVILFGAGTDYCLFLIMRYREEMEQGLEHRQAVAAALRHVGNALAASALTTILGLGMMFFAKFGKFHNSGPIIGICLAVTLLTCVTLTPAIMIAAGRMLFWPTRSGSSASEPDSRSARPRSASLAKQIWQFVANMIIRHPGLVLSVSFVALAPVAGYGIMRGNRVTYDFLSGLPEQSPSRQGADILKNFFPIGESGPVTVLVDLKGGDFESPEGRQRIGKLSDRLYVPGVRAIRSIEDPLGEFRPGETKGGLAGGRSRRRQVLRVHPKIKAIFVAHSLEFRDSLVRLEVILEFGPFSIEAVHVVDHIEQTLKQLSEDAASPWYGARFALAGTTAAIRDLRSVTREDNTRIQILVVLAVLIVLLVILRRPAVCVYMMLSVLFSYYVALGITQLAFSWVYGEAFYGLDWKVPLFLFVILVAIGQDYNVYLTTRVLEEQARLGPIAGLRRAIIQTGGIITSCGVIMAGTFFSMTSSAWSHWIPGSQWLAGPRTGSLQSILELGFALSLGVLLDTFVVRPILLPAFLALLHRRDIRAATRNPPTCPPAHRQ